MKVYIMIPSVVLVMFEAVEVILPTVTGLMGILENHTTMITGLDTGIMLVKEKQANGVTPTNWSSLALFSGVAVIQKNYPFSPAAQKVVQLPEKDETCVVVLVSDAEFSKNLDPIATKEAYLEAQSRLNALSANTSASKSDTLLAKWTEKRTRARYQVTQTLKA